MTIPTYIIEAAKARKIDPLFMEAVRQVESGGVGFEETREPKILFEAHVFSRLTNHKYDETHPKISSKLWNKKLYVGGRGEHRRLTKAVELNREAALQSASWGEFQVLGENWKMAGYPSIQAFVNDAYAGPEGHFRMFLGYLEGKKGLIEAMQKKDEKETARLYNGEKYAENKYDVKIKEAFKTLGGK